jgi:uncharacterized protein (DUF488 family)
LSAIYTIGHSTRAFDEFIALLAAHEITRLGDIRTVPRSRRHPHFSTEALAVCLPKEGIAYRHFPGLGGLRRPRPDSTNGAWRHPGFRGYADYMETAAFDKSLGEFLEFTTYGRATMMCAEGVWWRCHRQLVADALVVRGHEVRHIMSTTSAPLHSLTAFGRIVNGKVQYPGLTQLEQS